MIPVAEAEKIINQLAAQIPILDQETVNLYNALGRVLAEPIISKLNFPHDDNSAMDGYAVKFADVVECSPEKPITLQIVEEIPAGYAPQITIQSGQTARIFTGGCLPVGADTIVMQEYTKLVNNQVTILKAPNTCHEFVRRQGSYAKPGDVLIPAGRLLNSAEIAVLAASQSVNIPVYRKVRVAILSTGDELVTPDTELKPGQLVDSNQYALYAAVTQLGGEAIALGIIPDQPEVLKSAMIEAIKQADIVLSTGGVSVGDYDYVEKLLGELGGKIAIRSVAVKPGKPLTVASFPEQKCLYFGLPGNPVSALVTFWRFVQPAMKKMSGLAPEYCQPHFINLITQDKLISDGKRESYLWGKIVNTETGDRFSLAPGLHNSGNLINLVGTRALAILPVGTKIIEAGEPVQVLILGY
jgi:molybdopterin molybdotransferase